MTPLANSNDAFFTQVLQHRNLKSLVLFQTGMPVCFIVFHKQLMPTLLKYALIVLIKESYLFDKDKDEKYGFSDACLPREVRIEPLNRFISTVLDS